MKKVLISLLGVQNDLYLNYLCLRNMFVLSLLSSILKYILKKKRRSKTKLPTRNTKKCFCCNFTSAFSKFGFPSNHTVFFVNFYLDHSNIFVLLLTIVGIWSRVYFEHHTIIEISESIGISIALRDFLKFFLTRIFKVELDLLDLIAGIFKLLIEQK